MQALDAGSAAALPDGLRAELEQLEDHGGVRHLHDLAAQIKVSIPTLCTSSTYCKQRQTCMIAGCQQYAVAVEDGEKVAFINAKISCQCCWWSRSLEERTVLPLPCTILEEQISCIHCTWITL